MKQQTQFELAQQRQRANKIKHDLKKLMSQIDTNQTSQIKTQIFT